MKQALRCGCPPSRIIFDSPCKSPSELEFALRRGIAVNANSYAEVEKIAAILTVLQSECVSSKSVIGLRVNPMVGAGNIAALSTATATSKFGVPCKYSDQVDATTVPVGRQDLYEEIIHIYLKHPFLTCIMCHVGSQGMPIESMVEGVQCILTLADTIDTRCQTAGERQNRITHADIGGGLSANYDTDEVSPTFQEYAQKIASVCENSLRQGAHRVYMTEFGKALVAKCGAIVAKVEEAREFTALVPTTATTTTTTTPNQGKNMLAVVQAGADLLLRTCYCPDKFPHRIMLLNAHKQLLTSTNSSTSTSNETNSVWSHSPNPSRPVANVTVAGPLCFSGDVLAKEIPLPEPVAGDIAVLLDCGANTLSIFSRHCSRLSPAVYAFRRVHLQAPVMGQLDCNDSLNSEIGSKESVVVACIRPKETEEELLHFWG